MRYKVSLKIEPGYPGALPIEVELWNWTEMSKEQLNALIEAEKINWGHVSPSDFLPEGEGGPE